MPALNLQHLHLEAENESFNTDLVMGEPLSPHTQQRMREQIDLILNDGTELVTSGPTTAISSKSSHGSPPTVAKSPEEVNSIPPRAINTAHVPSNTNAEIPIASLEHEKIQVTNGGHTDCELGESSKAKKIVTWSSLVSDSVPQQTQASIPNIEVSYNEDGFANISPPREFLVKAQKQWDSSLTGHFIGGSFSFKFIREQAMKLWSNLGLSRVYYSSKGYFTFRFNTVEMKNKILGLNSVQIGGKTMYLMP